MASQRPNPIPVYISGDASGGLQYFGDASYVTSSASDPDGGDAIGTWKSTDDPKVLYLLRKVKIYSRGTNGAGTAYLWVDDNSNGPKECIAQISWDSTDRGLVRNSGTVVYINMEDEDPDAERMRGYLMRGETRLYIQITDGSISDGYRVHCEVRNLTQVDGLQEID